MMKHIRKYRKQIIQFVDLTIIVFTSLFFYQVLYQLNNFSFLELFKFLPNIILLILGILLCQGLLKTYDNLWRYAGSAEYIRLIIGVTTGFIFFTLFETLIFKQKNFILFSILVCVISNLFMLLIRFFYCKIRRYGNITKNHKISVVIIGAGIAGVRLMEEIIFNPESNHKVFCFFDDSSEKIGKKIRGIKVLGPIETIEFFDKTEFTEVIIAIPSLSDERKREILNILSKTNLHVKILPDIISILQDNNNNLFASARDFQMDDLLGRESVSFEQKEINSFVSGKVILVTGGGGSIGSELCRQIARSNPAQLVILDNYENNAYDIQQELIYEYKASLNLAVEIASVQDKDKLEQLFSRYQPQVVFHAAAHKHVPFMETCPDEAIKNNIFGTYNTAHIATKWKVEKFVLISTDKAVNPTSMMGASKRVCEMIIQSMKSISNTEYVAVRFGNVLGSNGSVIPLFRRQIEHGGPVTITDKRAYRYFMTIPEAAQLVLRAGAMASHSEIYVLDMGQPVSILTLAENLIRLMGYVPYTDIPILEIGIRDGEKLYEELLMQEEGLVKTVNQKIFIERQKDMEPENIEDKLEQLRLALDTQDVAVIRETLKRIVPTFSEQKVD